MAAKWRKSIPYLRPKWLKNHILWGCTYLYSRYKRVPPLPGLQTNSYILTVTAVSQYDRYSLPTTWVACALVYKKSDRIEALKAIPH